MNILIAPNAFKNSLEATLVAGALKEGLEASPLHCSVNCFPVGDGGDGTASLLVQRLHGTRNVVSVSDPLGRSIESSFGLIEGGQTAVIEMADASGIRLLKDSELNPLVATSYGTGELIRAALGAGASRIIICLGGSATVDGGAGLLSALGVVFKNSSGLSLEAVPESLQDLESIDLSGLDSRLAAVEFIVLCDVDNFLLGEQGAAAVFGPQKGASNEDVQLLDQFLTRLSKACLASTGKQMETVKHGGAAGGVAASLFAFLGGRLVQGADYFLDASGFDQSLEGCNLVITGEGSLDIQTLEGKAPFAVAKRARNRQIPVIGIAGNIPMKDVPQLDALFSAMVPIGNKPTELAQAIRHTHENLVRTGAMIGKLIAVSGVNKTDQSDSM